MTSAQKSQSVYIRHQSQEQESIYWEDLENPTPQVEPVYQWATLTAKQTQLCSVYAFQFKSLHQMLTTVQFQKNLKEFISSSFPPLTDIQAISSQEISMKQFQRQIIDLNKCCFQMSFCGQTVNGMIEMLEEQDNAIEMLTKSLQKIIKVNMNYLNINAKQLILRQKRYCLQFIDDQYKKHISPFMKIMKQFERKPKANYKLAYSIYKSNEASDYAYQTQQKCKELYKLAKQLYHSGVLTYNEEYLSDFSYQRNKFTKISNKVRILYEDMMRITQEAIQKHYHNTRLVYDLAVAHRQIQQHTEDMRKELLLFLANTDSKAKSTIQQELECEKQRTLFLVQLLQLRHT